MPRLRRNPNDIVLRPVHPNTGIEAAYRRKLTVLIDEMNNSIAYWLRAAYRANEPEIAQDNEEAADGGSVRATRRLHADPSIAQDESPAAALRAAIRRLAARWTRRFDVAAKELAAYFAKAVSDRSDAALRAILKKGGISVEFRMTRAQNDILQATIAENVSLIKSIPARYLTNVEGLVMRSVQTGRDLGQLTKDLQEQHGVTKWRAAFIARDQANKSTAALVRARYVELGITEAIWVHSAGGKEPRPTHVKAGREQTRYDVRKGWFDPHEGEFILPGQLINCRCVARPVVKGFS